MIGHRAGVAMVAAFAAAAFVLPATAQTSTQSSTETIRIVFPFAAGGSGDTLARLLAEHLRVALDVPVIVENRTGAQGRIGVQAVKAAAPDGKTLLLTPVAPMSIFQHVYKVLTYDPVADFQPVSQVATFDFAIAVGPQVPANTVAELVQWVKANPGQGSYGIPAAGSLPHFFGVLFGRTAGLDLRHVSYRGSARSPISSPGSCRSSSLPPRISWSSTGRDASVCSPPRIANVRRSCATFRLSRRPATTLRAPAGTAFSHPPALHPNA